MQSNAAPDATSITLSRPKPKELVLQGQRLQYFTVAWNTLEALVSVIAGLIAGSVALVGGWSCSSFVT